MQKAPKNVYAVILAGGSGTRFWPRSRQKTPKQLCSIGDSQGKTMLENTLARISSYIPPERCLIVTHKDQFLATKDVAGNLCARVIPEPQARNTANALALAAMEIEQMASQDESSVMVSLHADHVIKDSDNFLNHLHRAVTAAEQERLVLMGIAPRGPETGFGYIEQGSPLKGGAFEVARFCEKPDQQTAEAFIKSGKFLWNSGIFVWKNRVIIEELAKRLPATVEKLQRLINTYGSFTQCPDQSFAEVYADLPKIAIDHAVLEVSDRVAVIPAEIDWQDIGSWDALPKTFSCDDNGNYVQGKVLTLDTKNCVLDSDGPMVAAIGLENLVVAYSKGAILVCPKDRCQDVKKIVASLEENDASDFL